jgi:hypothetical protein
MDHESPHMDSHLLLFLLPRSPRPTSCIHLCQFNFTGTTVGSGGTERAALPHAGGTVLPLHWETEQSFLASDGVEF